MVFKLLLQVLPLQTILQDSSGPSVFERGGEMRHKTIITWHNYSIATAARAATVLCDFPLHTACSGCPENLWQCLQCLALEVQGLQGHQEAPEALTADIQWTWLEKQKRALESNNTYLYMIIWSYIPIAIDYAELALGTGTPPPLPSIVSEPMRRD